MNSNTILFHGTSVGWLMQDGFRIPYRPFGEAGDPPRKFIYLCSNPLGAETAAWQAFNSASRRLKDGDLTLSDFSFQNNPYPPAKYVYEVEFQDSVNEIDLYAKELNFQGTCRICKGLVIRALCKSPLTLWRLPFFYYQFRRHPSTLDTWIRKSLFYACGLNDDDGKVVELLTEAGFDLVTNIHSGDSYNYNVVYALIVRVQGAAFDCVGTPKAGQALWP
jgi:hypothetical protein